MVIYKITNLENEKFYIGKTARTVARRWRDHLQKAGAGSKTKLHRAIMHYGADTFEIVEICCVLRSQYLDDMERHFIAETNAMGDHGYNLTPGGDGAAPGIKLSAEHRAKLSAAHKGKQNHGNFKKGHPSHMKGKTVSTEVRKKISTAVSASLVGNTRRRGVPHSDEIKKRISASMKSSWNSDPSLMSSRAKGFWASMTPEYRIEFIARKEAARQATLCKNMGEI